MPLEKEEESMEIVKAKVLEAESRHFIRIGDGKDSIDIPISEDNPNKVKSAFNKLLVRLKTNKIKIELEDVGTDLFSQVANEYIAQLNRDLSTVHREMVKHQLVEE